MERSYRLISLFFILIYLVVIWGFYRTYLMHFPDFKGFQTVQHFHGFAMSTWLLILIVQPLLIANGKTSLHHLIGRISYLVAPIVVLSVFMVTGMSFHNTLARDGREAALSIIALQTPLLFAFSVFYILAILNRKFTPAHMRYMIGTALLMIGPGLGRALIVYFGYPFPIGVNISDYIVLAISGLFLLWDILKGGYWKATAVVFLVLLACHLLWANRDGALWHSFAAPFSRLFF